MQMIRYIASIVTGTISLIKGMIVTLKHMTKRSITIQYPEKRAVLPLRFRGRLVMPVDPEKGTDRCTACLMCIRMCPNHTIGLVRAISAEGKPLPKSASFTYNLATCMFCNLCVEVCPFFALVMSDEFELAQEKKDGFEIDLVAEKYRLSGIKAAWWQNKFTSQDEG